MIITPFSIKFLREEQNKLSFEIEPLYPGYGVTLGNTLRRVLLSSIEGAAITWVKIKGVSHEFSVLPGIKENILEITLNLKQVKLKLFGDEPQKIELKAKGERKVKAGDIKTPSQVEIVNKDLPIASLTSPKAKLEMEMMVEKGFGYVNADQLKKGKSEVGVIYLDAIFTPILKVSFNIENVRFEKRTDYNKLMMEIETDGTIDPKNALQEACRVLICHFKRAGDFFKIKEKPLEVEKKFTLEDLKLSPRVLNRLQKEGIKSLSQLLRKREEELEKIKGLGEKGIKEIKKRLKGKGFELKK